MITNNKQYKITKRWIEHFQASLVKLESQPASENQSWLKNTQRQSLIGQLEQLHAELNQFESINGKGR